MSYSESKSPTRQAIISDNAHPPGRFLRSRRDRILLYESANGLCELCGVPLGESWHADHIEPWVVTHRTSVFEMQALCAECNTRKGAATVQQGSMSLGSMFDWDAVLSHMRRGQRDGVRMIRERILRGEKSTTLQIPTRYGKSDMMRIASVGLHFDDLVCASLVVSPNELLRDQMANGEKWENCLVRCRLSKWNKYRSVRWPEHRYTANGEAFLSLTIQLLTRNLDHFLKWADSMTRSTGKTGILFVDETHAYGEGNTWGSAARSFMDMGWHVVLLTATPWRADGQMIPGFDCEVIDEKSITYHAIRRDAETELKWLDTFQGVARMVHLKADYTVTFKEAWAEVPSPLCKLSRVPFDVELSQIMDDETWSGIPLSSLSKSTARTVLGKVVRDPVVIREGVMRMLAELRYRRAMDPTIGALIFCGNDTDAQNRINEHAEAVMREITRQDHFDVVIATNSDGSEGKTKIERFVDPKHPAGDILIVKQMASVGLDGPRIKIVLDLSTVRTVASFIQRIMRAATPYNAIRTGTYITVDDALSRELFDDFIDAQGGAMKATDAELIETHELEETDPEDRPTWIVDATLHGDFQDHAGNAALAARQDAVNVILRRIPELSSFLTWPEIANRLTDVEITAPDIEESLPSVDIEAEIEEWRDLINGTVKSVVNDRLTGKRHLARSDFMKLYGEMMRSIFRQIYQAADVPIGLELKKISDIALLKRIAAEANRLVPDESYAYAD